MSKASRKAVTQLKNSIYHQNTTASAKDKTSTTLWALLVGGMGLGMGLGPTSSARAATNVTATAACTSASGPRVVTCTSAIFSTGLLFTTSGTDDPFTLNFDSGALVKNNAGDPVLEILGGNSGTTGTVNIDTGAMISVTTAVGGEDGVSFDNVTNLTLNVNGTIDAGTSSAGDGIFGTFSDTLEINVGASGSVSGFFDGIDVTSEGNAGDSVLITNQGSITGANSHGIKIGTGTGTASAISSVTITNSGSGTISGENNGIHMDNVGSVMIINFDDGHISGTTGKGIAVHGAGTVNITNSSPNSIIGGDDGIELNMIGSDVTIDNDNGAIVGAQTGINIDDVNGGDVFISNVNGSISGIGRDGINVFNVTDSDVEINNSFGGSIFGNFNGIFVQMAITPFSATQDGHFSLTNIFGSVSGLNGDGVHLRLIDSFVSINNNNGTISGAIYGVHGFAIDGTVNISNQGGTITGGVNAVTTAGGVLLSGVRDAVTISNNNGGSITGTLGIAINSAQGDVLINNSFGGVISGATLGGVAATNIIGNFTVTNTNSGTIDGGFFGVFGDDISGDVMVDNALGGSISGGSSDAGLLIDHDGVKIGGIGGSVLVRNSQGGFISGVVDGVDISDVSGTSIAVDNSFGGTITGGTGDGVSVANAPNADVDIDNSFGGTITGGDEGVEIRNITGSNVDILNAGGLIFGGDDGIFASNVDGWFVVTNVSGAITGLSDDGIDFNDVDGFVFINNTNGSITGLDNGITGFDVLDTVDIFNTGGTILGVSGAGIALASITKAATINNGIGGVVNGGSFGIALFDGFSLELNNDGLVQGLGAFTTPTIWSETPAGTVINNTSLGVIQGVAGSPADVIIRAFSGTMTVNNSGLLLGRIYSDGGNDVVNNSGTWSVLGSNDFGSQTVSGSDVVNNSGLVVTAFSSGSLEVTSFLDLEVWNNAGGLLTMLDGAHGDTTSMPAAWNGGSGSQLGLDTFLGAPGSISDVLNIGSSPSGSTNIIVIDSNAGPGAFNPTGILLVNGSSVAGAFALDPTSSGFNAGLLQKGLWDYQLVFNGSQHLLVGLPGQVAHQMPSIATGAQAYFAESTGLWRDRTADLRYFVNDGHSTGAPGAWVKGFGNWGHRSDTNTHVNALVTNTYNTSYDQNMWGVMSGLDGAKEDISGHNDTLIVGIMAGYGKTTITFDQLGTRAEIDGVSVGGYLTYLRNNFYADAVVMYDLLDMDLTAPSITGYSGSRDVDVRTFGAVLDMGYKHNFQNSEVFIEPLASLIYATTKIDNFTILGTTVDFNTNKSFRGSLGLRAGGVVSETSDGLVDFSVFGRIWEEFKGNNTVIFRSAGPALAMTDDFGGTFYEVGGTLNYLDKKSGWSLFLSGGVKFDKNYQSNTVRAGIRGNF